MCVKFLSAILGPEMAAPIVWTPVKMPSFCRKETSMSIKFLVLRGGILGLGGGGSADFIFMGTEIFLNNKFGTDLHDEKFSLQRKKVHYRVETKGKFAKG